ncbi:MAG: hypothetical protein VKS61_01175 [Candidatus Sericytochromatia bacterium]|nr:hypothetical protein [Candidatus Sericytochromatia bacterium]
MTQTAAFRADLLSVSSPQRLSQAVAQPGGAAGQPVGFAADSLSLTSLDPIGGSGAIGPREREALIRAVAAEARGESFEVQVAVAQTIINYSRRQGYPIPSLVRSSYLSSNYDHNRVYFTMHLGSIENLDRTAAAVDAAIRGEAAVGRQLIFFRDSSGYLPPYADHNTKVRMGRMTFFREVPGVQI